jgi:glucose-6-phosphate isomerase
VVEGTHDKVITFVELEKPSHALSVPQEPFAEEKSLDYMRGKNFHQLMSASLQGTRDSYTESMRPNVTVKLPQLDAYHMGQLLHFFQVQTALAGDLLNINPFDQPGVERAKVIGKERLSV